eukprot:g45548.t1
MGNTQNTQSKPGEKPASAADLPSFLQTKKRTAEHEDKDPETLRAEAPWWLTPARRLPDIAARPVPADPNNPAAVQAAKIAEVVVCGEWIEGMNNNGYYVHEAVMMLEKSDRFDTTYDERLKMFEQVRSTIRKHDAECKAHLPRCVAALQWCESPTRIQSAPEADGVCRHLGQMLLDNRFLMTETFTEDFQVMRRFRGYVKSELEKGLDSLTL